MKTKIFRKNKIAMRISLYMVLFLFPLLGRGLGGGLWAQNGVTVSNLVVEAGTVTLDVHWDKNAMPVAVWSDTVWVFVDYNDAGVMKRLPVTSATATAGTVTKIPGNEQGVWVAGNARTNGSFSATVQLYTATAIAHRANVCAYASNYPPVGQYTGVNRIKFTGTPSFDLQLNRGSYSINREEAQGLYDAPAGKYMVAFTDATGAPGRIVFDSPCAGVQGEIGKGEKDASCTGSPGSIGVDASSTTACTGSSGSIGVNVSSTTACTGSPGSIGY